MATAVVQVASVSPVQDAKDPLDSEADIPSTTQEPPAVITEMHLSPRSLYPGSWPTADIVKWYSWMPEDARSEILAAAGLPVTMSLWKEVPQWTQALGDDGKFHADEVNARPMHKIAHVKGSWRLTAGGDAVPISTKFLKHEYTTLREYIEAEVVRTMLAQGKPNNPVATTTQPRDGSD